MVKIHSQLYALALTIYLQRIVAKLRVCYLHSMLGLWRVKYPFSFIGIVNKSA